MHYLYKLIGMILLSLAILCNLLFAFGSIKVNAASVGDVIAKAREIGMPESQIQGYIAQYGGRDYTSEQCDQAIAALEGMRGQFSGNNDETSANDNGGNSSNTETLAPTEATTSQQQKEFFDKSSEDQIKQLDKMSKDDAKKFWDSLSDKQKNDLRSILNKNELDGDNLVDAAKDAAEELGIDTTEATTNEKAEEDTTDTSETVAVSVEETESEPELIEGNPRSNNSKIVIVAVVAGSVVVAFIIIAVVLKKSKKD